MRSRYMSVGALALFGSLAGAQTPSITTVPQISTSATGEARVQPDRATIMFAVETRAGTAARAGVDNAKRQQAVLDTLKKLGLVDGQLSTAGYSLSPEMRHDGKQPQVVGYVARNMVKAEVRRIDQVGTLIDAALTAGANVVSSLRFFSSKADEARQAALAEAVGKARREAESMAVAAGGSLGTLIELETAGGARPMYDEGFAMGRVANSAMPIEPGEQTLTVLVSARWAFVPAR